MHGWKPFPRKPRAPRDIHVFHGRGSVGEGARPSSRHARRGGVRQFHSTAETGEQRQLPAVGGVGGGKGTDRGEHRAVATGPDSEPGFQVAWSAKRASSRTDPVQLWSSASEVGAVCGSSARTDLCGGWPERAIPTAILFSESPPRSQGAFQAQTHDAALHPMVVAEGQALADAAADGVDFGFGLWFVDPRSPFTRQRRIARDRQPRSLAGRPSAGVRRSPLPVLGPLDEPSPHRIIFHITHDSP